MVRKLLALLILVTGLAAMSQPAQARMFDVETVRTAADAGYACAAQPGLRGDQLSARRDRAEGPAKICPRPPRIVLIVPTVMLKADRARE